MDGLRMGAWGALAAGIALLAYAAIEGSLRVGLFLIVPFVYGTGPAAALGMLLLMVAGVLWFVSAARRFAPPEAPPYAGAPPAASPYADAPSEDARPRTERRHGGVVLLGPIPIVWGSDRRILPWMVAAGVALLALALLVSWGLR